MAELTGIHIYPVRGRPGEDLRESFVEAEGLVGDRRKKAAVQVVAAGDVRSDTRANLVVSLDGEELSAAIGCLLRVGEVELDVTGTAHNCPGVYAAVRRTGTLRVGDGVDVVDHALG